MIKKVLKLVLPAIFWLGAWEIIALFFSNRFLFPSIGQTALALYDVVISENFIINVSLTLLRVLTGLIIGVFCGALFAFLTNRFEYFSYIFKPVITIFKSTPVASFIIILWIIMNGSALSVFICFMMVMPIVWQNLVDGYNAIDKELLEVSDIFEFDYFKKARLIIFPTLFRYLIPAIITSVGLAWKSEIAAEIIAYTENSIGAAINDSKMNFDTPSVFAWTLIVIALSVLFERLTAFALRRFGK